MAEKKERIGTAVAVLALLAGTAALLYPFASEYLYERNTGSMVRAYEAVAGHPGDAAAAQERERAQEYNAALAGRQAEPGEPFGGEGSQPSGDDGEGILDLGDGLMCYIEIPAIGAYLPVYHGTGEEVLEKGVGHLSGSSLPVGGEGTHCVLSGHTGLNRAKLFTDLTMVESGDLFYLHTLGETLAYQVDRIRVVEPEEVSGLGILEGEDLVTLVTCTPYGVNSHRLLVRGSRVPYSEEGRLRMEEKAQDMPRSRWMREYRWAMLLALAVLAALALPKAWACGKKGRRDAEGRKGKGGTDGAAAGGGAAPAVSDGQRRPEPDGSERGDKRLLRGDGEDRGSGP